MFKYTIEGRGFEQAKKLLARRILKLSDFRVPLTIIAKDFYSAEEQWLDSEGGGRWKPLSKGYALWKKQNYPGRKILQLHGGLYADFTGRNFSSTTNITGTKLSIHPAESRDYWWKHQRGYERIPKREVLSPVLNARKQAWKQVVTRWLISESNILE